MSHGTRRAWPAQFCGKLAIGPSRARWNCAQRLPDLLLKCAPLAIHGLRLERLHIPIEVAPQSRFQIQRIGISLEGVATESPREQGIHSFFVLGKIQRANTTGIIGEKNPPNGRLKLIVIENHDLILSVAKIPTDT